MARNVVLHMGFLNIPYTAKTIAAPMRAAKAEASRKKRRSFSRTMTTETVGNILEEKYNILESFKNIYHDDITKPINEVFNTVLIETLTERKKFSSEKMVSYMKPKTKEIEKLFRRFLDNEIMDGEPGVPVKASLTGKGRVDHKKGPSFVNTGMYRAAFTAWVDIK
jgi:hypothetical protein